MKVYPDGRQGLSLARMIDLLVLHVRADLPGLGGCETKLGISGVLQLNNPPALLALRTTGALFLCANPFIPPCPGSFPGVIRLLFFPSSKSVR